LTTPPEQNPRTPLTSATGAGPTPGPDPQTLERVIDSIVDFAIFTLDPAGRVTWWARGAEQVFGFAKEEIVGELGHVIFTPEDRAAGAPERELAEARKKGMAQDERWHLRRDGSRFYASGRVTRLLDSKGGLVGFTKICTDVTARKTAEEELTLLAEQQRLALDSTRLGSWRYLPAQGVVYLDPQAREISGLQQEVLAWERLLATVHAADRETVERTVKRALQGTAEPAETFLLSYRSERAGGIQTQVEIRAQVQMRPDGTTTLVGTMADVTERRQREEETARLHESRRRALEDAVEARRAAQEANRMKDEFLAVVSHELRTPLNAIIGWSALLDEAEQDPQQLQEGLQAIRRNADAQAKLIEDILDLSRITSGKVRTHPKPTELSQVINAAVTTIQAAAAAKDVQVEVKCAHNPRLNIDPDRMQQVFWNLLSNAVKFTPSGGRVIVRTEVEDTMVAISFADTGQGIEPEFLPHVFDRFRQADATANRRHGGLGLGLAIVRHLVELNHGTVAAASAGAGQGSTFTIRLPLELAVEDRSSAAPATPAPPASPAPAATTRVPFQVDLSGKRVIVLDDDPDARRVVETTLSRYGAKVTSFSSVADAMTALANDRNYDAVISDIGMPQEDGYVFARRVRALERELRLPRLPLAALTAFSREQDRTKALQAGFDAFISKPIRPTELTEIVTVMVELSPRR
jgi:PAS domain S-box-containing protein